MIVLDPGLARTEIFARIEELTGESAIFARVKPETPAHVVMDGVRAYAAAGCDSIVAVGGGSSIAAGKAIRAAVAHGSDWQSLDVARGTRPLNAPVAPMISIPTLAGACGSIGTRVVVRLDSGEGALHWASAKLMPSVAIFDPDLVRPATRQSRAIAVLGMIGRLLDATLSPSWHPACDAVAFEAWRKCSVSALAYLDAHGDDAAIDEMYAAAMLEGIAEQKGLGVISSIAEALMPASTTAPQVTYGAMMGVTLAAVARFARARGLTRIDRANRAAGRAVEAIVQELLVAVALPQRLSGYGFDAASLPELAAAAMNCAWMDTQPGLRYDEVVAVLRDAF